MRSNYLPRLTIGAVMIAGACLLDTGVDARLQSTSAIEEATPFGLRKGMTTTQARVKSQTNTPGLYHLSSVPRPHPDFESYVAQIAPKAGLCFIKAMGRNVQTNVYGHQLKEQFTKIRDQIASTYGKYDETDVLLPDSIWDEPKDWTMGLLKKERALIAEWSRNVGSTMRPSLDRVFVGAAALSTSVGYVAVEYYFDNEPQCDKEIDSKTGSVF